MAKDQNAPLSLVNQVWFHQGLKFKCTGCGKCCTGEPGYVWLTEKEAEAIANQLKLPLPEFLKKYTRRVGKRLSLIEKSQGKEYDCIFLKGKQCTIYELRPKQCRTYPWWKENVHSMEDWIEESKRCEGINHADAPLISLEEIQTHL